MKTQYEMLEAKLNAAHAVITEVQNLIRLMHDNGLLSFKDETSTDEGEKTPIIKRDATIQTSCVKDVIDMNEKSVEAKNSPIIEKGTFKQSDLFGDAEIEFPCKSNNSCMTKKQDVTTVKRTDESADEPSQVKKSKSHVRHRGEPAVDRKGALQNFRDIVKGREIIHLADVNRIFGYNESTSGHFVRDAIKTGRLTTIDYGKSGKKFLAKVVREFIKCYFDRKIPRANPML